MYLTFACENDMIISYVLSPASHLTWFCRPCESISATTFLDRNPSKSEPGSCFIATSSAINCFIYVQNLEEPVINPGLVINISSKIVACFLVFQPATLFYAEFFFPP